DRNDGSGRSRQGDAEPRSPEDPVPASHHACGLATESKVRVECILLDRKGRGNRPCKKIQGIVALLRKEKVIMLPGARKDSQQVNEDWERLGSTIDGVSVREVRHVPRDHGVITEIFRPEWD